eukprot:CAMPEP_0194047728 /NCGR_PEP_ID=MMETSP0009_2-20130614/25310_1 /TAXON_ID=210454 /ORGANISM="Grammatophora oceanica, Strain CCMP 410" /LENGTH=286 /DNA_ID=CAMNT_0038693419 /DNA_START=44 /DNA_END=904 /DNA_ORIENTATION=+
MSGALRTASVVARRCVAARSRAAVLPSLSTVAAVRGMASLSGGASLTDLATDNPHKEAIRYHHKNLKFTYKDFDHFSDSLASGMISAGLAPGDVVLSWLPANFLELHVLQFACSKAGFVLYELDPAQATTDPEGAKAALTEALVETEANILFSQEAGSDVDYIRLLKEVIPETRFFQIEEGQLFISPRFPHLRYPVHTGLDEIDKKGFWQMTTFLVPDGELPTYMAGKETSGATPLKGELVIGPDGMPKVGKTMTNDEVVKTGVWPVYNTMLKRDYQEIEGIGNIF